MAEKRKALEEVFNMFDKDGSGSIDKNELKNALREYYNYIKETADESKLDAEASEIMKVCDESADGKISKAEWFKFFDE